MRERKTVFIQDLQRSLEELGYTGVTSLKEQPAMSWDPTEDNLQHNVEERFTMMLHDALIILFRYQNSLMDILDVLTPVESESSPNIPSTLEDLKRWHKDAFSNSS